MDPMGMPATPWSVGFVTDTSTSWDSRRSGERTPHRKFLRCGQPCGMDSAKNVGKSF